MACVMPTRSMISVMVYHWHQNIFRHSDRWILFRRHPETIRYLKRRRNQKTSGSAPRWWVLFDFCFPCCIAGVACGSSARAEGPWALWELRHRISDCSWRWDASYDITRSRNTARTQTSSRAWIASAERPPNEAYSLQNSPRSESAREEEPEKKKCPSGRRLGGSSSSNDRVHACPRRPGQSPTVWYQKGIKYDYAFIVLGLQNRLQSHHKMIEELMRIALNIRVDHHRSEKVVWEVREVFWKSHFSKHLLKHIQSRHLISCFGTHSKCQHSH